MLSKAQKVLLVLVLIIAVTGYSLPSKMISRQVRTSMVDRSESPNPGVTTVELTLYF